MRPFTLPPALLIVFTTLSALVFSCVGEQHKVQFSLPRGDDIDNTVESTGRALTDEGHPPAEVEASSGLIMTAWEDTGQSDGTLEGKPATLLKRFRVTVAKGASENEITVEMDVRRCAEGFVAGASTLTGSCEEKELQHAHQRELQVLGERLRATLSAGR
jgi:hypothetical protein